MKYMAGAMRKSVRFTRLTLLVCCLSFFFFASAQAARVIDSVIVNGVTLTGSNYVEVSSGQALTVQVNVTLSSSDQWGSTDFRFGGGTTTCYPEPTPSEVDDNPYGNKSVSTTYTMTAPTTVDEEGYDFRVRISSSTSSCSSGRVTQTFDNAIRVMSAPTVSSIVRASTNPAATNSAVSWTVTFSRSVTGVDAGDFELAQSMGVSGASITSVTGSGTTWTVTANTGNSNYGGDLGLNLVDDDSIVAGSIPLGGAGAGNGNTSGPVYMVSPPCVPPENLEAGLRATLTCVCDNFNRTAINSPTGPVGTWIVSNNNASRAVPYIPSSDPGYLRLTENTTDNATVAIVPGAYPAKGNFISVEFRYFAYNGSSADGVALTFATYPATSQGAYGGSLGYAQKTGINGFSNGWVGIGIDEFGNYQNPTEGRQNLPAVPGGYYEQSVAVRGSGNGTSGYYLLGGTGTLSTRVDSTGTARAPGHRYQMIVDAQSYQDDGKEATVTVRRATTGSGYSGLVETGNVYSIDPNQAVVPDYWQLSLTGSTGTSYNIHEIGSLRICAQTRSTPPVVIASGFNAIDEAYGTSTEKPVLAEFLTGHIYTKLAGTAFNLYVGALTSVPQINTSLTGNVTVRLVDDENGACRADCTSTACTGKTNVASLTQNFTSGTSTRDNGIKLYGFTVNKAYKNLIAIISNSSTTACSTDSFSVRPSTLQSVSTTATQTTTSGTPIFKAGSAPFSMTVSTTTTGYTGTPEINSNGVEVYAPATNKGAISGTFNAAVSSSATGSGFTYDEVGAFTLRGYTPIATDVRARGIHDTTWTAIDSVGTKNDCVAGSYTNTKDANGKYGCRFGLVADWTLGRFVPDHFAVSDIVLGNRTDLSCSLPSLFTYMGEPLTSTFTLTAQNVAGGTTKNYFGSLAKLIPSGTPAALNFNLGAADANLSATTIAITNITRANPAVVTAAAHGLASGDWILIAGVSGMRQINDGFYQVTVTNADTFVLNYTDTSAYTAYASGGAARKRVSNGSNRSDRVEQISSAISWPGSGADLGIAKNVTVTYRLNRPAAVGATPTVTPDGPLAVEFGIAPLDSDSVTTLNNIDVDSAGGNDHASIGVSKLAFGRMKLSNAHGSERLNLPIPLRAEYWNGTMFVTNTLDSCTQISSKNVLLSNYQGGVSDSNIPQSRVLVGTSGTSTFSAGVGRLSVRAPLGTISRRGSVDLCVDLGADAAVACDATSVTGGESAEMPWLKGKWKGSIYDDDPKSRVTFGIYKSDFIYIREMY